jgi:hypothetical protein
MKKLFGLPISLLVIMGAFAISAIAAPAASASQAQCSAIYYENPVCAWTGNEFGGEFTWWPASSKGCHNHSDKPNLRSFWNMSPYTVRLGGATTLAPGAGLQTPVNSPVTGEICWPA